MVQRRQGESGFTLIELMISVAVVGILSSLAVPNYLGMQSKSAKRSLMQSAASCQGELVNWLQAWADQEQGVIDYNGDGVLDSNEACPATVADAVTQFTTIHQGERSPYNQGVALFAVGPGTPQSGQISLEPVAASGSIVIRAWDSGNAGNQPIWEKTITVDR